MYVQILPVGNCGKGSMGAVMPILFQLKNQKRPATNSIT